MTSRGIVSLGHGDGTRADIETDSEDDIQDESHYTVPC